VDLRWRGYSKIQGGQDGLSWFELLSPTSSCEVFFMLGSTQIGWLQWRRSRVWQGIALCYSMDRRSSSQRARNQPSLAGLLEEKCLLVSYDDHLASRNWPSPYIPREYKSMELRPPLGTAAIAWHLTIMGCQARRVLPWVNLEASLAVKEPSPGWAIQWAPEPTTSRVGEVTCPILLHWLHVPIEVLADRTSHPLNGQVLWNLCTCQALDARPAGCLMLWTSYHPPSAGSGLLRVGVRLGLPSVIAR
jgi:hypothetical protein